MVFGFWARLLYPTERAFSAADPVASVEVRYPRRATPILGVSPAIARVKQAVDVPVVANGDVVSTADAQRILQESGCDAVMTRRFRWR